MLVALAPVVVVLILISVAVDPMHEHANAAIVAAADSGAHGRGVVADARRRALRNKDQIALGIGGDRMRARGLRYRLDQHARAIDHAKPRRLFRRDVATRGDAGFSGPV